MLQKYKQTLFKIIFFCKTLIFDYLSDTEIHTLLNNIYHTQA